LGEVIAVQRYLAACQLLIKKVVVGQTMFHRKCENTAVIKNLRIEEGKEKKNHSR
jgi:hypothetical protein